MSTTPQSRRSPALSPLGAFFSPFAFFILGATGGCTSFESIQHCACETCDEAPATAIAAGEVTGAALCALGNLEIVDSELQRYANVVEITGALIVDRVDGLTEFTAWPRLQRVGAIQISDNRDLERIALDLETHLGGLWVVGNPRLERLTLGAEGRDVALPRLEILDNPRLEHLGLAPLTSVDEVLRIADNRTLTELDLGGLEVVGHEVAIHSLDLIDTLRFSNLRETDEFRVLDNPGLRAVEAPGLTVTGGVVEIGHNPAFEELTIGSGDGSFARIHNNDSLVRLVGFDTSTTMIGIWIHNNATLTSLPWPALQEVGGVGVLIRDNPALEAEVGALLPTLEGSTRLLWIFSNPALDPAAVAELVARVTAEDSVKTGNNRGEMTAHDPCPWLGDGFCDAELDTCGNPGTRLCAEDPADCACE